jgi:hypothetical protein
MWGFAGDVRGLAEKPDHIHVQNHTQSERELEKKQTCSYILTSG